MKRLERDDLLIVTRLDRLARSTRDLLNILRTAISRTPRGASGEQFKRVEQKKIA